MKEEINNNIKQKILFYIKENNFKSAEKLILKALKKYSNSSYLLELLAHCQYNEGEYEDAIRSYNIILKSSNNISHEVYFMLGNSLGNLGHSKKAIDYYEKSLLKKPNQYLVLNNIGLQYELLKDFNRAKDFYTKTIKLKNNFELGYTNLAGINEKIGNIDESFDLYRECLKINNTNELAILGLANINLIKKSYNDAYNLFNQVLELNSSLKAAYTGLGNVLLAKGEYLEGLEMLQKGLGVVRFTKGNDLEIINS
jgi:tetratricopeptide (TPR) repeat protein